jgi:hypothetical protein
MPTEPRPAGTTDERPSDEGTVPLFGSWPVAYGAVIVCAVVVMALVALFSRWPW